MHEEDKKLKKQKENNDYKKDCCSKKNKKHLKHLKEKDHYKKLSIQEELEKRQAAQNKNFSIKMLLNNQEDHCRSKNSYNNNTKSLSDSEFHNCLTAQSMKK